jgi:trans-2,3-dihydro-3-hydroxyanthranilate isomerase
MGDHRFTLLDVFTATPLAGNGLAVIHDADGVDDATMHAVARETRLSETSFVQSPQAAGADYRHRIWMMTGEIPFAGHPSLGTAVAVARARGETRATYVQQTEPGLQPIEVELDGARARASMLQEPPVFGPELDPAEILPMVGLTAADAHPELPVQIVATGVNQVIVPVADAAALGRVRPDYDLVGRLLTDHEAITYYLVHLDPDHDRARARSFMSTGEKGEDPATGSSAGPLCAYAAELAGTAELTIVQGVEMGRPSELRTRMEGDRPRVGGDAVVLVDGTLHLDAQPSAERLS